MFDDEKAAVIRVDSRLLGLDRMGNGVALQAVIHDQGSVAP